MNLSIAVIAKECVPGQVKTRLTPPLTPGQAAALAQVSLSQSLQCVRSLPATRRVLVFDGTPHPRDAAGFDLVAQSPGRLDQRLAAICSEVTGPLLILGMDTPHLSRAPLAALLADWSLPVPSHDSWIGPASDGGFWALALQQPDPDLIEGVKMSTPETGAQQAARITAAGLVLGLLPTLRDVDHFADALAAARECPGTPFARAVERLTRRLPGSQARVSGPVNTPTRAPAIS
ncbi:TIGR04282 family arsenosugar biosynthesis glycosyltransferase [Arthrobacter sp. MMS24-T111]